MPIACDPTQTLPVQLKSDEQLHPAHRATFYYRALTVSQHRRRAELLEQATKADEVADVRRLLNEAICIGLAGWKNLTAPNSQAIPFPGVMVGVRAGRGGEDAIAERLDQALTPDEKWDLAYETGAAVRLAVSDKKKSVSRSTSVSENSAVNVPAASA